MLIVNFHQTITHFDLHSSDTLSLIINRRKFMPGQTFIRISHTFGFKSGIGQERTVVKFPPTTHPFSISRYATNSRKSQEGSNSISYR